MFELITEAIIDHQKVVKDIENSISDINRISEMVLRALQNKKKILLFGNGGSASDSQHIAAEIVGRFEKNRGPLPAVALTTDTSILTSIANDFSYEEIFSRQVDALAESGDIVIGFSTSGKSKNVINGIKAAKKIGCTTIGFLGRSGEDLGKICDACLLINSDSTARIQECHIFVGHILCKIIDSEFTNSKVF